MDICRINYQVEKVRVQINLFLDPGVQYNILITFIQVKYQNRLKVFFTEILASSYEPGGS